jgi:4-hydroxy-tetrahydrodipicolinate reductase
MEKVIIYGVGEIAKKIVEIIRERKDIEICGAIDIDEKKIDKNLSEITKVDGFENVVIRENPEEVFEKEKGAIVLHLAGSYTYIVIKDYIKMAEYGMPVITITEEMTDPYLRSPELAEKIDKVFKDKGVPILATGINPGYLMDFLPAFFSGIFKRIEKIEVTRINNASKRRYPLQRKIGSGLSKEVFYKNLKEGKLGHVGLAESGSVMAKSMGLKIKELKETCDPKIADSKIETNFFEVVPGQVCGILHRVEVKTEEGIDISLFLEMSLNAKESYDEIKIRGEPSLTMRIKEGVPGDECTANLVVNWINKIRKLSPGLWTIDKLIFPSFFKKF